MTGDHNIVREYVFYVFLKIKKRDFTFFEAAFKKNVKT